MTDSSVSRFWDKFIHKTKSYGVKDKAIRWYVRHAEAYIKTHKDLKLKEHNARHVEKYLKDKGRNKRLEDWQYQQIIDSLKLLFTDMVKADWAKTFPWDEWVNMAKSLPNSHATVARDYSPVEFDVDVEKLEQSGGQLYKKVYALYPRHITNLIKAIRSKHYSIRTEQAYLGWFLRFVAFHSFSEPSQMKEEDIARYLESLVYRRHVSPSTQSQALNSLVFFFKQVLNQDLSENIDYVRPKKPRHLPVVLSRAEVLRLLENIESSKQRLMASLLYGCGLRLMECIRLRVLDVDFDYQQIVTFRT